MDSQLFNAASLVTATNLRSVARSITVSQMSQLSLPEIDAVVDQISRIVPAGNIPGMILSGLAKLTGRRPAQNSVRRDINLLFRGVEQALDTTVYGAFFAGPAAVLWGYQKLMQLVGRPADAAFPDGVWQFYVNYALREDTARHANETEGFDAVLNAHGINLTQVDRITAWTMAAIHTIHSYPALLANEWRERVALAMLRDLTVNQPDGEQYARLYSTWEKQRPYGRGGDVQSNEPYAAYRQRTFDRFLRDATQNLNPAIRQAWLNKFTQAYASELPAYQQQMSILAVLEAGNYEETSQPIALRNTHIAVIHQGQYYLIPVCNTDSTTPHDVASVRSLVAALLASPTQQATPNLRLLASVKRSALSGIIKELAGTNQEQLAILRCAPIMINTDQRSRSLPLAELRRTERGIGDHPLTLIDTGSSMVFDQSHIFFDGAWGAALAEIMTQEALAWAVYLQHQAAPTPARLRPYAPTIAFNENERQTINNAAQVQIEASAESAAIDMSTITDLRRMFKQRSDLLRLTVNDMLVLYRAIHAVTYEPPTDIKTTLSDLARLPESRQAAEMALLALDEGRSNPAMLIPIDGSQPHPRERLHPMTFEVPLDELNILGLHQECLRLHSQAQHSGKDASWEAFDHAQKQYLATLAGFGEVLSRAKEIALSGESTSSSAIRLLAHVPPALQRVLDGIPGKFDILNDIIKGREVFSNVGAVVESSSLTRFITAKDDNAKKTLAWGVLTDADGVMHLSLRDFRPHVAAFASIGRREIAVHITGDYLDQYVNGINIYVRELRRIVQGRHAR